MMLAGLPDPATPSPSSPPSSVTQAPTTWQTGSRALVDEVKLLALSLDERALLLTALEDPPQELAELRAVLLADHQWRLSEGLD